ncbi:MAG: hypothetical protein PHU44_18965 [Syntrophales bacterium]|nr:hypothetical protein [Syntrophales bacterium]
MNALPAILQSLGVGIALSVGTLTVMIFVFTWWVRRVAKGSVYAYFVEENKQISTKLSKVVDGRIDLIGPDGDPEAYVVHPDKTLWTFWPPGVPQFLKVPIPSNLYVRDQAEPIDPYKGKKLVTASSLRYMTDEGMLKQTWKEARESVGLKPVGAGKSNMLIYILLFLAVLVGLVSIYMVMGVSSDVDSLMKALTGGGG